MFNPARLALFAALLAGVAGPVFAADLVEPPVVEQAPPPAVYEQPAAEYGGWYIRGDIDYHWSKFGGADYITYGPGTNSFDSGTLKSAFSAGAGVGYQINQHFRTDLTADWLSRSKFNGSTSGTCGTPVPGTPCTSVDTSSYSALLLLANAYIDIGTWHGVTPYVGAGIGGAWMKWDTLNNTDNDGSFDHGGGKGWRFAYALMAGASYCLTDRVKLDVGYRYSHINGGRMFDYAAGAGGSTGAGPGFDHGISVNEVRGGLRYQFGRSDCAPPPEPYVPEPEPVYTK